MTDKWSQHFAVSDEEWTVMWDKALNIWDNLEVTKDPENLFESNGCPMHPQNFIQLSNVAGFNNMNGYTYEEYIAGWEKRRS